MKNQAIKFLIFVFTITSLASAQTNFDSNASFTPQNNAKNFNPYFNLLGMITLGNGVGVDFKLADKFAIGPTFGLISPINGKDDGKGYDYRATAYYLGIHSKVQLSGTVLNESGWYLGPEIGLIQLSIKDRTDDSKVDVPTVVVGCVFGYHWNWASGFNFALGAGARYFAFPSNVTYKSGPKEGLTVNIGNVNKIGPTIETSLGFAF